MTRVYKKDPITVGRVFTTFNCGEATVIEYINSKRIKVKFDNTLNEIWCRGDHLKTGNVKDHKAATVFGKGIVDGCTTSIDGKLTTWYNTWSGMLERCYSKTFHKNYPTYIGCSVAEEWLHLPTFKLWFDKNHRKGFQIDKDLLVRGNKVYSEDTCVYVPRSINNILKLQESSRGSLPIGVTYNIPFGKYISSVSKRKEERVFGYFDTPEEAFLYYKKEKESYIKEQTQYYFDRGDINQNLYQILIDFEIEDIM